MGLLCHLQSRDQEFRQKCRLHKKDCQGLKTGELCELNLPTEGSGGGREEELASSKGSKQKSKSKLMNKM